MAASAVGYLRVSTADQASSGLELEAQQAAIEAACLRAGLPLTATYVDAGLSGSLGVEHRPGLADAIATLGPGDALVVAKRDRIARDSFLAVLVEREVHHKGARCLSAAGEGTESDDPAATFTRRILDAVAELERALIAARTRAAMQAAKARGQRVGHVPYGSRLVEGGRTLAEHPEEQAVLAEIRRLRRCGWSHQTIATALNAAGLRTRRGEMFQRSFVGQLLMRHAQPGIREGCVERNR